MTCKDCIHYEVCYSRIVLHMDEDITGKPDKKMEECKQFLKKPKKSNARVQIP